jgi:hypothetical protein
LHANGDNYFLEIQNSFMFPPTDQNSHAKKWRKKENTRIEEMMIMMMMMNPSINK